MAAFHTYTRGAGFPFDRLTALSNVAGQPAAVQSAFAKDLTASQAGILHHGQ